MKQITFAEVAHMYLGCKIQTAEGVGTMSAIYMPGDIKPEEADPITCYDLVKSCWKFDEVKPILRKPSAMEDAEIDALYKKYQGYAVEDDAPYQLSAFLTWAHTREGIDLFGLI